LFLVVIGRCSFQALHRSFVEILGPPIPKIAEIKRVP
jgi:hypothetical protein